MNMTADTGVAETPEFEIKRTLTTEDKNEFLKFTLLKYRRGQAIFTLVFTVLMFFIGIRGRAVGMDMWWLFVLTAVLTVVYFSVYAARANRTNMNKAGREAVYLFYSDRLVNRYDGRDANIPYTFCEAFEYGNRIFIVVNKREGYVLSINDFSEPEKFRGFLREKLGKKFR